MSLFLVTVISCVLSYAGPGVVKFICGKLYGKRACDVELRKSLVSLKTEMSELNMVENFSKYAKLQRMYNKLEDIHKGNVQRRLASRLQMELLASYGLRMLNGLIRMVLLYIYWERTVINLPDGALWPLNNILCWPHHNANEAISVPVWLIVISMVTGKFKKLQLDGSRVS